MTRYIRTWCLLLLPGLLLPAYTPADEGAFSEGVDLQQVAQLARNKTLPVLVMFSAEDCEHCVVVREDFLALMLKSGDYADKVIMRVVEMDSTTMLRDFDGSMIPAAALANRYSLELTPTVILVDARGSLLVDKLAGLSSVDMYGGLLDEAIFKALAIVQARD